MSSVGHLGMVKIRIHSKLCTCPTYKLSKGPPDVLAVIRYTSSLVHYPFIPRYGPQGLDVAFILIMLAHFSTGCI